MEADADGTPLRLRLDGPWQSVSLVRRPWRVDQHWWRDEPVRRAYFRVAPEDGPPLTLYREAESGRWFRQEYA